MAIRDLLVVLDGAARDENTVATALAVAGRLEASVTALCPLELLYPGDLAGAIGAYPQLLVLRDVAGQLDARLHEQASQIESSFQQKLKEAGLDGGFEAIDGAAMDVVATRARIADLVVIGQAMPGMPAPVPISAIITEVLMRSGRPVLLVPFAGKHPAMARNVLIGWSGTREAARAVHDALPLLAPGARVTVLSVQKGHAGEAEPHKPGEALAEHLVRHGFAATAARTVSDHNVGDADALLNFASDLGADLLVTGAYGHSRVREIVLGGVTNALLDHATLPVLMSH
ncbi:MAG: universal stress protein [Proteobacteria bacterium]|nr:universal stress protein [Pseudomonadota bacterium]